MNNLINGDIFLSSSTWLIKLLVDHLFSMGFLIILIIVLGIKYGFYYLKKYKASFFKNSIIANRLKIIFTPIGEDIKNIIYGLIGVSFSWTIINFAIHFVPPSYPADNYTGKLDIVPAQLNFAHTLLDVINYAGLVDVILVSSAFLMLTLSFIGPVFKSCARFFGVLAIFVFIVTIYIGVYADLLVTLSK